MDAHRVYVTLQDQGTIALDRETGDTIWTNRLTGRWPPVLAASDVVAAITTDEVAAFDRATGSIRWRVPLPANSVAPAVSTGELVVVALENGSIVAIRTRDGTTAWMCRLDELVTPVSLAADADTVYMTTGGSHVAAVTSSSGDLKWRVNLSGQLSPPAVGKDRLFVGSTNNAFFALDAGTGTPKWNWRREMIGGDVVGAAVDGDVAYFVGLDNLLRAVNRGSGAQRWKQPIPMRPIAPPAAFGGIVAVFGISPAVATFNARTGTPLGTYSMPAARGGSAASLPKGPPLIDPDLRPFQVAMVAITADGRAIGLRPEGMMFREPATVPLSELPGRSLPRERLPPAATSR